VSADFHENYTERESASGPSNRSFGLTVGGILLALGLYRGLVSSGFNWLTLALLAIGAVLATLGLAKPAALTAANRAWMQLGVILARIINPVIMLLVYGLAFVPTGLLMRWRGHDPLRSRRDRECGSYWIERSPSEPKGKAMARQY
jgi:hypothetical protein